MSKTSHALSGLVALPPIARAHRLADRRAAFAAALLAIALSSLPAHADGTTADALFEEALRLRAAGNVQAACRRFEKSHALDPSPGTLLNIADCRATQGQTATAWTTFRAAAALGKERGRPDVVREATLRATELERNLARLTLHVPKVNGMKIEWDGVTVPDSMLDQSLPVDPGQHVLRISAPGFESRTVPVTVARGPGHQQIVVPVLTRGEAEPEPLLPKVRPERRARRPRDTSRTGDLPLVFIGGGALLTTAGFLTKGFVADCSELCGSAADVEDLTTIAHVLWGAAGVSVAVGLTIAILDPGEPNRGTTVTWNTGCGRSGCGTSLWGTF